MRSRTVVTMLAATCLLTGGVGSHAVGDEGARDAEGAPRIIGGEAVAEQANPGAVHLDGCTGTLIAPTWVLTARHCVDLGPEPTEVGYGTVDRLELKTVRVQRAVTNPDADTALLQLAQPIGGVTPVTLAAADPAEGTDLQVYGWGRTSVNGRFARMLKTATMRRVGTAQDAYGGLALELAWGTGQAWQGDSGGPAIVDGVQVGVLSTGDPTAKKNWYASVATSRAWIKATAGV